MYVDDQLIVNKAGGVTVASGSYNVANNLSLTDGADHVRRVRVEFTDTSGNAALTLNWTPSGGAKVAIPVDRFRPRYSLQTRTTASTSSAVDAPAQVTHTQHDAPGVDPALGMITKVTEDPAGLKLATTTGYEAAGYGVALAHAPGRNEESPCLCSMPHPRFLGTTDVIALLHCT